MQTAGDMQIQIWNRMRRYIIIHVDQRIFIYVFSRVCSKEKNAIFLVVGTHRHMALTRILQKTFKKNSTTLSIFLVSPHKRAFDKQDNLLIVSMSNQVHYNCLMRVDYLQRFLLFCQRTHLLISLKTFHHLRCVDLPLILVSTNQVLVLRQQSQAEDTKSHK